ncbi:3-oxoacyl-ACP reductase FabG [soil metagenome]
MSGHQTLAGRVAIVTGASQGLGREIAHRFALEGATVVICARDRAMLEHVREELAAGLDGSGRIVAKTLDVSDANAVQRLVAESAALSGSIDILVNSAGVYGPMGPIEDIDWEEWVRTLEINLFGSVMMCRAVVPVMKKARRGKIVQLSGGGATNPMPNLSAYAASKAAIVRFAETLAMEVRPFGIDVNALAPGALNTRMLDEVLAAGPQKVGADFHARAQRQKASGGAGLEPGAELALFLASDASNGITGKLISALWDAWPDWPAQAEALDASDAFTLRRLAGRDRGLPWADR